MENVSYRYNYYDVSVCLSEEPKVVLRQITDAKYNNYPIPAHKREKRMTPKNIFFPPSAPEGMKRKKLLLFFSLFFATACEGEKFYLELPYIFFFLQ